ncbi:MAG: hypothetical protein RR552_06855, partial [Oscillospiraceae bacterium]
FLLVSILLPPSVDCGRQLPPEEAEEFTEEAEEFTEEAEEFTEGAKRVDLFYPVIFLLKEIRIVLSFLET